jgi:nucleoside-diphosphate-sugar epimerase
VCLHMQVAAERVAWELSKEHGFKLCVINPTFVLGPVVSSRTDATSIDTMKARRTRRG